MELKPIFQNLKELPNPICKMEWDASDIRKVRKKIQNLFMSKTLTDRYGQTRHLCNMVQIEDFFGLPYTSSSSYALVTNTNNDCYIDKEDNLSIGHFALTTNNEVVVNVKDPKGNEQYFAI